MLDSVKINGYRAFQQFELANLGRINLLVGKNNTGKSSILEGLYILASGDNPTALWHVLMRRGEQTLPDPAAGRVSLAEADISHLFYGHEIHPGVELSIETTNSELARSVKFRIDFAKPEDSPNLFAQMADEGLTGPRLALWVTGSPDLQMPPLPLSQLGSLRVETLQQYAVIRRPRAASGVAQFITTESMPVQELVQLWTSIVLTPDEDRVIEALKILEPKIERIAQVQVGITPFPGSGYYGMPARGGFFVKLAGDEKRIPIGSFGDGIWRTLAIVVAMVRAKGSVLLVDEIDTGLHHTVMADMWRLLDKAADLFNVQIFATTHSYDCIHSLASICRDDEDAKNRITIQRIEAGNKKAIPFSEPQIKVASERDLEIR